MTLGLHAATMAGMGKVFRLVVVLCGLLLAARARAGNDPRRTYFTIVTPHFAVHYNDDGEAFAREVADYLEEARTSVGELLGWYPAVRVHVLAADDFDSANGFASVIPAPAITVWAWPPPPDSELGNYGNWLKVLVVHEYTHIAHLDHSGGLPEGVNTIFGRIWKPNNALPRWATEGLAVWVESQTGLDVGRNGSSGTEMFFRTSALANRLPHLSDLTGSPLEQPRGSAWYLYGGAIYQKIEAQAGADAIRRFVAAYGSWGPPYALNLLTRETTGKTMVDWFAEVRADITARAKATEVRVRAAGLRVGRRLRGPLDVLELPRFSPDGKHLLWLESNGFEQTRIVSAPARDLTSKALPEPTSLLRCEGGCGRFMPTRDGARLIYGTSRDYRRSAFYNHLAVVPLTPGETLVRRTPRILSESLRAYDPTPAADGRSLWAVRTVWSVASLARFDLETGEVVEELALPASLTLSGSHARADRPVASADGKSLFVSLHANGNRDLYRIDLGSHAYEALTHGAADELDPALSPDERWLFYSSDRDGISNIYARELATGVVKQVTNVLGGASNAVLSPDGHTLIYRGWTVEGPALYALDFEPDGLPVIEGDGDGTPSRPRVGPVASVQGRVPYHPLPTLLPRSWLPSFTAGSSGPATIGLSVEATDPTNRFGLVLSADWDLTRDDWTAYASFALRTGFPDLSFQLGRYSLDRTSFVGDLTEPYREEVIYSSASIALPVPDVFAGLTWGMGFNVDLARGLEVGALEHTPDETMAVIPEERVRTSLNMFASFSDVRQHPLAIAPSEGLSASFNLGMRDPALGGDASAFTFTFVTRAHVPLGKAGHTLSFRLGGGLAGGDPGSRSVFSLGGVPQQDLLSDLLNQTSAGAVWLRGFDEAAFQGTRFGMLTGEWRFPLVRVRSGVGTLPVFFEDLSAAVFSDVGGASYDSNLGEDLVAGLGAELRFRMELWFGVLYDFRLGYAHGFGDSGGDHVYFMMAGAP